jgi:CheY-like chemotaxis protein
MRVDKPTVLVVEDDENDFELLRAACNRTAGDLRLLRVEDGDLALAYLAGEDDFSDRRSYPFPHLLLLDIKLPRRSGLEVLESIRKTPLTRRLPVVMLTASRLDADVNRAYELGATGYFQKPETLRHLTAMLADLKSICTRWLEFPMVDEQRG